MAFLEWIVDYFKTPPWTDNNAEVFKAAAMIQMFLSTIMLLLVTSLIIEMRKGPGFILRILVAILVVSVCILFVQSGVMFHWFHSSVANCIGTFFFCLYTFLDIEIYWTFASRYFDVSMHLKTKLEEI